MSQKDIASTITVVFNKRGKKKSLNSKIKYRGQFSLLDPYNRSGASLLHNHFPVILNILEIQEFMETAK